MWLPENKDDWELPDEYYEYQNKVDDDYEVPEFVEDPNLARPDEIQYRMATQDEMRQVAELPVETAQEAFANAQLAVDGTTSILVVNGIGFDPNVLAEMRKAINERLEQERQQALQQGQIPSHLQSNL
jgi:hypothetical protein